MISWMKDPISCRFDPATRLWVSGSDAASFLQGQFTNDLRHTREQACTYGLWLNQKGRVLADSFVLAHGGDKFEIISLTSPVATIRERLEAYIIADDVVVDEAMDTGAGWIVAGDGAVEALAKLDLPAPEFGEFCVAGDVTVFRVRAASSPNWLVLGAGAGRFDQVARPVTRLELARGRIESGVPEIPTELGPGDLPQEGGLEPDAISFTKGCYLGQEVMARLHNLGQVRRRLFVVKCPENVPVGAHLFLGDRPVGEVRACVPAGEPAIALAMLHTSHVSVGATLATTAGGAPVLEVLRLAEGRSG
jgi:folate-binding protein YgfZ